MAEQENGSKEVLFINPGQFSWQLDKGVHVWKFPAIPAGIKLLTVSERAFANRFRFEGDKSRFAVGRQALRMLLSKYLSVPPMEVRISAEKREKPFISMPSSQIHFNISHSGDWVLVALAVDELGIDIEKMIPDFKYDELLHEHFSETERDFIFEAVDPVHAFYYLWTRKEALTKAWGTGLQENLKMVSVLGEYSFSDLQKKTWRLDSFKISAEYPAGLAYSGELKNIIYLDGKDLLNVSREGG